MAINDFEFPGVELHQEFVETPVTGQSQLGVVVIGHQIKQSLVEDWVYGGTATVVPLSDASNYATGDVIDTTATSDISVTVVGGEFLNFAATGSSTPLKISGGTTTAAAPSAVVTFDKNLIKGSTAFGDYYPAVGDSVMVKIGSGTAKSSIITDIAGKQLTVVPADGTYSAGDVTEVSFLKTADAPLTSASYTVEENAVTIAADAVATFPGKSSDVALQTNTDDGDGTYSLIIRYKDADKSAYHKLQSVGSMTEIREAFGIINADNPMAVTLAFALQAAAGNVVYYTATSAETTAGYEDALDFIDKYQNLYSIVPVTTDAAIIQACIGFVERVSSDVEGKTRYSVWYGVPNAATVDGILDGRQGTSYRAQAVWADDVLYNGQIIGNYAAAAAAAGMRSGEVAYRPISNLGYNFFSLKETNGFTKSQLKQLGQNGIWIIANNYDGTPINLRQLTTAVSNNLNKDEESIVANADSIALTLCRVGENLVGCSNISPDLLVALHDTLTGIMDRYLLNLTGNAYIGPQLLSYTIDRLEQDPIRLDHIYATITCEPPKPFNRFVMTLRIV